MTNPKKDSDQGDSNHHPAILSQCFRKLGHDSRHNIDILVEQACQLLEGTFSSYHRIGESHQFTMLSISGDIPENVEPVFTPDILKQVAKSTKEPIFLSDATPFPQYIGIPVHSQEKLLGVLSVFRREGFGSPKSLLFYIQILTSAIAREESVLKRQDPYRILVECANDAIYIIQDGQFKYANPKTFELTGYREEIFLKTHFSEMVHPDDREQIIQNHLRRLNGEEFESTYTFRLINRQKETVWVQINAVRIFWEGRPAVLGYLRDISPIKELETKLKRAEKMELVGTMAGGVAHDLNNILSGLVSYPELLLMQIGDQSPLKEAITFMHDAGLKAAEIVQDLLTLTRRGIPVEDVINLNNMLHEYFNSPAHKRLKKNHPNIRFTTDSEPDLLNIMGSPSHISKIIMNLVINAAEAVKSRGHVHIRTFNRYIDMPLSGYDTIEEGDYVVLSISDDGDGISPRDLDRIFEPFYTKKQMGRSGSGLGLSVVWNCLKDHKGYIEIYSTEHEGTRFDLFFPATRKANGNVEDNFDIDQYSGTGQTVLVVDDIEAQRKIARDCLKLLGYTPFVVASGEKAIAFIKQQPVDLVLLDMKMEPGIDGYDTFAAITEIRPGQKAVIASGFSENERVKKTLALGAGQYIKKPFTLKNLAQAIHKELAD